MTWWLWRGAYTRSHPELGRENPQRPWYCVLRHGRVGRRQVLQPIKNLCNNGCATIVDHPLFCFAGLLDFRSAVGTVCSRWIVPRGARSRCSAQRQPQSKANIKCLEILTFFRKRLRMDPNPGHSSSFMFPQSFDYVVLRRPAY